jgi:hypothetical protein
MADSPGWRRKPGVIAPSANFAMVRIDGPATAIRIAPCHSPLRQDAFGNGGGGCAALPSQR